MGMRHVAKVRIYPNSHQQASFAKAFGCVRWLWN
ncbi:MAG: transposase, partial [Cyanobacteria bacterium QH_2_48_84]